MSPLARRIVESSLFQHLITLVILLAGVLVGLETSSSAVARWGGIFHALDRVILAVFVAEIMIKVVAEGDKPWRYFRDPWNVFDFSIVAVSLLPVGGQYVTVLRLARLLRVLRLVHVLPRLQLLVNALLKSIPSMGYVGMLLGLLFYVYGVAAVFLFAQNDPVHFGSLGRAMLSLFTVVTLEGWAELMYIQMYGCDVFGYDGMQELCREPQRHPIAGPLYFVTFVLFGTMIVLNLFIGVIMNSMQEAASENEKAAELKRWVTTGREPPSIEHELFELQSSITQLGHRLDRVRERLSDERSAASKS
jgi:voltage-gated sodium channel